MKSVGVVKNYIITVASKKEKLAVIGATQYSYCKAKRNLSEEV